MKTYTITLELPDDGRQFKAFKGRELVAREDGDTLLIKTVSCNYCGECCMNSPNTPFGNDDEGKCNKLVRNGPGKWECSALKVPFDCLDDPFDVDICCIKYESVRIR